jgi:transcriptional regulator of acetoin/glycerol metabolism
MAVGDADARLLWVEGHPVLRRRAERMNFVEGAAWEERWAGTNAPGTAMALNRPVQIVAAEHYCHVVQPWTCSAAPIRDPHTHDVLGFVDLTGGDHLGTPVSLALVRAVALAA